MPPALNVGVGRNAILDAALAKFQGVAPWKEASRKFKMWSDVPQEQRPALYLTCPTETRTRNDGEGAPPMIILNCQLFIYTWSVIEDDSVVPSTAMSELLDKLDQALLPTPLEGSRQRLGGLVSHCWIEGQSFIVPGDLDGDGLAVLPLKILIPS